MYGFAFDPIISLLKITKFTMLVTVKIHVVSLTSIGCQISEFVVMCTRCNHRLDERHILPDLTYNVSFCSTISGS